MLRTLGVTATVGRAGAAGASLRMRRAMSGGAAEQDPRRAVLKEAKRVLIKVGTAVVSRPNGTLALSRMGKLCEEIAELSERGVEVMLVSSGAVGLGARHVGLSREIVGDQKNIVERQASAAAGQESLMSTYDMMFNRLGLKSSQVLITQSDLIMNQRYNNLTDTISRLASLGVIPIINENDVVTGSAHQLGEAGKVFSDNDMLAALLSSGAQADGVCMLTDVEAVFTKPPDEPGAERIKVLPLALAPPARPVR